MPDLSAQLREYLDATASPVEVEEIMSDDLWIPSRKTPPKKSTRSTWAYGVAAVFAVLIVGIGLALLVPGGNENEVVQPTPTTLTPDGWTLDWWPQANLDQVRAAQELADAEDPDYTWQLDAKLAANEDPWEAEIFARFIEEELGWDAWEGAAFGGYMTLDGGGRYDSVLFIRCAPGETNPLSPLFADAPPEIRRCSPTIDELTYETVRISVAQPERRGSTGIWVVDRWDILQPTDPNYIWEPVLQDYLVPEQGVEQRIPPSEAEVTAFLEAFLEARMSGEGAEQYVLSEPFEDEELPLLYVTTDGASYDRFEIEPVQGPVWPTGSREFKVRLFTEDGAVVEQYFRVVPRESAQLGLLYGDASNGDHPTTENGEPVAVPHSVFGDTLTFTAPPLVPRGDGVIEIETAGGEGRVIMTPIGVDPSPDSCGTAADAEAMARHIMGAPNFETTETLPVLIAGGEGLQMDVLFSEQDPCYGLGMRDLPPGDPGWRMRLYLVDYPEQTAFGHQGLMIAVIAPETDIERVVEAATPILESLEIHAP